MLELLLSTAILLWDAPTQRTDGSELTDIRYYNVYRDEDGVISQLDSIGPDKNRYVIADGVRCVRMTTVDSGGVESELSDAVCVPVRPLPPNVRIEVTIIIGEDE